VITVRGTNSSTQEPCHPQRTPPARQPRHQPSRRAIGTLPFRAALQRDMSEGTSASAPSRPCIRAGWVYYYWNQPPSPPYWAVDYRAVDFIFLSSDRPSSQPRNPPKAADPINPTIGCWRIFPRGFAAAPHSSPGQLAGESGKKEHEELGPPILPMHAEGVLTEACFEERDGWVESTGCDRRKLNWSDTSFACIRGGQSIAREDPVRRTDHRKDTMMGPAGPDRKQMQMEEPT
jgi:hypothetical protein